MNSVYFFLPNAMQCGTFCFSLNQFKFKRNHSHMIALLDLVGALCIYLSELIWLYITCPNNVHCSPNQHPNRIGFMLRPHIQQFISCWTSQSINKSYIIFKREAFELSDWMNFQKSFNGCGSCLYKKNVFCKFSFIFRGNDQDCLPWVLSRRYFSFSKNNDWISRYLEF